MGEESEAYSARSGSVRGATIAIVDACRVGFGVDDRAGDGVRCRIEFELSTLAAAWVITGEGTATAAGEVLWFAEALTIWTSRPRRRKSSCMSA